MKNSILQLLAMNRRAPRQVEVQASEDVATVYLYDVIVSDAMMAEWCGGVAPEPFAQALRAITAPVIHLRINSPGGDVFGARAIAQALKDHPARIVAHVDGYAASAATLAVLAADEVEMAEGAFFMIHRSWAMAVGNSADMLDMAALLEKIDGTLADSYVARSGQAGEQVRAWMAAETWFTAAEALAAGFADRIAAPAAANAQVAWDLSVYAKAPRVPAPVSRETGADDAAVAGTDAAAAAQRIAALRRNLALRQRAA